MYKYQNICIRWNDKISTPFGAKNGIRQGSVLSPFMFGLYMNDLSYILNASQVGCLVGEQLVNHLMYADDIVLFCPSHFDLQKLINLCGQYGMKHDIIFNVNKTKCMCFRASKYKNFEFPKFKLHDGVIDYVNSYKYLGHIVSNINDKEDMDRQINFIYARGSTLIRNFDKCSQLVKVILFRSFICNVYCSHLWYNYTQRSLSSVVTAYTNIFRRFFHLPRYADGTVYSATAMLHDLGLPTAREIIATNATSLYRRIRTSTNTILVAFVDSDLFDRSVIRRSWVSNEYCT